MVMSTILLLNACSFFSRGMDLVIQSQEDQTVYYEMENVKAGDMFTVMWVHSVERTPWNETFQVTEQGELLLVETVFQSFGAGVPHQKGTMTVESGEIIVRDIEEIIPSYRWVHSHNAQFEMEFGDQTVFRAEDLPHHEKMEILIKK